MAVRPPRTLRYVTDVHVQIKPRGGDGDGEATGLLLYVTGRGESSTAGGKSHSVGGDFLSVSLHRGRVQLRYRLGQEPVTVVESLIVVNARSMSGVNC